MTCPHIDQIQLSLPTARQRVYRDECTRCFDSQDDPLGIDVCLSCFHGGCPRKHAQLHYQAENHPLVVNVKRIKQDQERPKKLTKLAIEAENDVFEEYTTIRCLGCGVDLKTDKVQEIVKAVLQAKTSAQQSQIHAWELELVACDHTVALCQNPPRSLEPQSLAHCSECDLSENLWLCLVCGNLACGRQQFGGGGGNGHGLSHFQQSQHAVAVKLGSLTPDGEADVYCYCCNEERTDPDLVSHLAHFGIQLATRRKTELSLNEMQLEQNLKWEFSMVSDDGTESKPLFGPGLTGIKNLGNTCYIASTMQCLFTTEPFIRRYSQPNDDISLPVDTLEPQLRKMADGLLSGRYSISSAPKGISPAMFKDIIGKGHVEFSTMRQQDAYEFLLYLLEMVSRSSHFNFSNPVNAFAFQMEERIQCMSCKRVKYQCNDQYSLSVPVPALLKEVQSGKVEYEQVSLDQCLLNFTAPEIVDYTCSACKSKQGASKCIQFKSYPDYLIINARRFGVIDWVPKKLEIPLIFPENAISLENFTSLGLQLDEEPFPEECESSTNDLDSTAMEQLQAMGFPQYKCKQALLAVGNNDTEAAMNWLLEHIDDFNSEAGPTTIEISEEQINMLEGMGFSSARAKKALQVVEGVMERAVEWLFDHPDDEEKEEEGMQTLTAGRTDVTPNYCLQSIMCHKGPSVHSGHWVAFARKASDNPFESWVLFNDEKVVQGGSYEEMSKTAYVYILKRI